MQRERFMAHINGHCFCGIMRKRNRRIGFYEFDQPLMLRRAVCIIFYYSRTKWDISKYLPKYVLSYQNPASAKKCKYKKKVFVQTVFEEFLILKIYLIYRN